MPVLRYGVAGLQIEDKASSKEGREWWADFVRDDDRWKRLCSDTPGDGANALLRAMVSTKVAQVAAQPPSAAACEIGAAGTIYADPNNRARLGVQAIPAAAAAAPVLAPGANFVIRGGGQHGGPGRGGAGRGRGGAL